MLQKIKKYSNSASKITFWLLFVILIFVTFNLKHWLHEEKKEKVIAWDVVSYYAYLPAIFVYDDLKLDFLDNSDVDNKNKRFFWPERLNAQLESDPNGKIRVIKTTMGMSFMYAPFFLMAHGYASILGYETSGFSEPYEFFLVMSCLFYFFIGLFYLRRILLIHFSETVTSLTLVTVVLGTNLFYYIIQQPAMSHAYSFSLIVVFIYQTVKWIEEGTLKRAIYIGLLGGVIVLIRPVNIFIFLLPLLYGVYSKRLLKERLTFFLTNWKHIIIIGVFSFLILLPQFLYWKYITGSWLFNSYVGEQFYFGNPHILEGLFSYRKGWLLYTPLMLLAVVGMILQFKHNKKYSWAILVFFLINTYVLYSWWCWWYGGSFGSRPMIDSYGLMAISIACFYTFILRKKQISHIVLVAVVLFVGLNQFQIFQRRRTLIHWDSMTKEAYWNVFLKNRLTKEGWQLQEKYIQPPNYTKARNGEDEYKFNPF